MHAQEFKIIDMDTHSQGGGASLPCPSVGVAHCDFFSEPCIMERRKKGNFVVKKPDKRHLRQVMKINIKMVIQLNSTTKKVKR